MIWRIFPPGAPHAADATLVLEFAMGAALLAGALLARWNRYRAHAACQTTVLVLNAAVIARVMWPSLHHSVLPHISKHWRDAFHAWAAFHAALGAAAELFGLYIVLVAGTSLLPKRIRIRRWKFWMRVELALWWLALIVGAGTYVYWYTAPSP